MFWSMAGAPVDEISVTLLTFGLSVPTTGLERSVRKASFTSNWRNSGKLTQ